MKKVRFFVFVILVILILLATIPVYGAGNRVIVKAKQATWLIANNTSFAGIGVDFTQRKSPKNTLVYRIKTKEMYDALSVEPNGILLIKGKVARSYEFCYKTWEVLGNPKYNLPGMYIEYPDKASDTLYITAYMNETCQY